MTQEIRGGLTVTKQQADVVDHVVGNRVTVVGAGAGSGKTHTTVATVMELVEQRDASLDQFVLITFTNKAADELRARLEQEVRHRVSSATISEERLFWRDQQERISAAYVGTIHGFCARVLRTFGYEERVAREASITFAVYQLTESLQDALEEAMAGEGRRLLDPPLQIREYELRRLAREILTHARGRGLDPHAIRERTAAQADDPGKPYRLALADLITAADDWYTRWKSEDQTLDADDLLRRTADLLAGPAGGHSAERLGERYRYVFIDEFQDTDQVQKQIVDRLLGHLRGVLVVGDRKQSIYGFRAADVQLIEQIAEEHHVDVLPLSISRRPTEQLLRAQNTLFGSMAQTYRELGEPLDPWEDTAPHGGSLAPITCVIVPKEPRTQRYDAVAEWIREALDQQLLDPRVGALRDVEPGDITILVRANSHLRTYERELNARLGVYGVEIRQDVGGQFYQQPEIVSTYRMLRLVLHYPSDPILSMALSSPYLSGLDASAEERRALQYRYEGLPITDWLEGAHPEVEERLAELRRAVRTDTVPQILERLYQLFAIRDHYAARGDQQAIENLEKLRELARRMFNNEQALTLRQFVDRMLLIYLTEQEEPEAGLEARDDGPRPPYIRIMTVHRAKGLEFPIVVIPELQRPLANSRLEPSYIVDPGHGLDVLLPSDSLDTRSPRFREIMRQRMRDQVAEEMRIFYVAVTRAQTAVALFGAGRRQPLELTNEYYAWQDEVLRARRPLEQVGGVFVFL